MKNSQKGFANIILIVLVLVFAGALGYVILVNKSTPAEQQQSKIVETTQSTSSQINTATNWKIYTNSKNGFSFQYPPNWFIRESADKNGVLFSKSEFIENDPNLATKIFAAVYSSGLFLGKPGSAYLATPHDYFNEFYSSSSEANLISSGISVKSDWINISGRPVFYHYVVGVDPRYPVDNRYEMYTFDKNYGFVLYAGTAQQPTSYQQTDNNLMKEVINTLTLSDKTTKFVNAELTTSAK